MLYKKRYPERRQPREKTLRNGTKRVLSEQNQLVTALVENPSVRSLEVANLLNITKTSVQLIYMCRNLIPTTYKLTNI